MTYNKIKNLIKSCEGGILIILADSYPINIEFILSILKDLKSEYLIKALINFDDILEKTEEKTIILFHYEKDIDFEKIIDHKNIVIILERSHNLISTRLLHLSTVIFELKNNKLNIIKNRYSNIFGNVNIIKLIRTIKLKYLNKLPKK